MEAKTRAETEKQNHDADLKKKSDDLAKAEAALEKKKDELAAIEKQLNLGTASTQNATGELLRVKDELKLEQAKVKDREVKIVDLAKTAKEQQDKAVSANIKARTYQERAETLAQALEQSNREFENYKSGKANARGTDERRPA